MISTQPCLDMPDGDLLIERGERGREGRRGIAVDQDHVRLLILQHGCQPAPGCHQVMLCRVWPCFMMFRS